MKRNQITLTGVATPGSRQAYDGVICALGYEERASFNLSLLSKTSQHRLAVGFNGNKALHYEENRKRFNEHGFQILECGDAEYGNVIRAFLTQISKKPSEDTCSIAIDVSCLNRVRIANLVEILMTIDSELHVDFFYSIAQYSPPKEEDDIPKVIVGAVSAFFAGWSDRPNLDVSCIVGLGYEAGLALGALDMIEADSVLALLPKSSVVEYEAKVVEANEELLQMIGKEACLDYDLRYPHDLFIRLDSMLSSGAGHSQIIIFPFGPKLFALISMLVAAKHPKTAVWRISVGDNHKPANRSGFEPVVFSASFSPNPR